MAALSVTAQPRWEMIARGGYSRTKVVNFTDVLNLGVHHLAGGTSQQSLTVLNWWGPEVGMGFTAATARIRAGYSVRDTAVGSNTFYPSSLAFTYVGGGMEVVLSTRAGYDDPKSYANFSLGLHYERLRNATYENPRLPPADPRLMKQVLSPWLLTLRFRTEVFIPVHSRWRVGGYFGAARALRNYENIRYLRAHGADLPHLGYFPPFGTVKAAPPDLSTRAAGKFWIAEAGITLSAVLGPLPD